MCTCRYIHILSMRISLDECTCACVHQAIPDVSSSVRQQLSDMGFLRGAIMEAMQETGHNVLNDLNSSEGAEVLTWLIDHNQNVMANTEQGTHACILTLYGICFVILCVYIF
jgi:hypothetical protein